MFDAGADLYVASSCFGLCSWGWGDGVGEGFVSAVCLEGDVEWRVDGCSGYGDVVLVAGVCFSNEDDVFGGCGDDLGVDGASIVLGFGGEGLVVDGDEGAIEEKVGVCLGDVVVEECCEAGKEGGDGAVDGWLGDTK